MSEDGFDRVRNQLQGSFHALKTRTRVLVDFKNFIAKGSALDLAVGVVIGAAFNGVVQSLVRDVLTPIVSIGGTANFEDFNWCIKDGPTECAVNLAYGSFITALVSFILTAAAVFFFVVRPVNAMRGWRKGEEPQAPDTRECPECLTAIPTAAVRCRACTAEVTPVP